LLDDADEGTMETEAPLPSSEGTLFTHAQLLTEETKFDLRKTIAPILLAHICDEVCAHSTFDSPTWITSFLSTHYSHLKKSEVHWHTKQAATWTKHLTNIHESNTYYDSCLTPNTIKRANSTTLTRSEDDTADSVAVATSMSAKVD
jgi:hypothetical protein